MQGITLQWPASNIVDFQKKYRTYRCTKISRFPIKVKMHSADISSEKFSQGISFLFFLSPNWFNNL